MAGLKVSCCRFGAVGVYHVQVVAVFIGALSRGPVSGAVAVENLLAGEGLAVGAKHYAAIGQIGRLYILAQVILFFTRKNAAGLVGGAVVLPDIPGGLQFSRRVGQLRRPQGKQQFLPSREGLGSLRRRVEAPVCRRRLWSAGKFCR